MYDNSLKFSSHINPSLLGSIEISLGAWDSFTKVHMNSNDIDDDYRTPFQRRLAFHRISNQTNHNHSV